MPDSFTVSGEETVGIYKCVLCSLFACLLFRKTLPLSVFYDCLASFLLSAGICVDNSSLTGYSITGIVLIASCGRVLVVRSGCQSVNQVTRLLFYYPCWEVTLIFKMLYTENASYFW